MGRGWRSAPLPDDWPQLRATILSVHRGLCHVCQKPGATEVDHVMPAHLGGTDHPTNLRPIHTSCHRTKTGREAQAARPKRKRPPEAHPGLA
jgi:5-methylcytosine-specific restriction endonuclease McrA